jgi:hypothetical protein
MKKTVRKWKETMPRQQKHQVVVDALQQNPGPHMSRHKLKSALSIPKNDTKKISSLNKTLNELVKRERIHKIKNHSVSLVLHGDSINSNSAQENDPCTVVQGSIGYFMVTLKPQTKDETPQRCIFIGERHVSLEDGTEGCSLASILYRDFPQQQIKFNLYAEDFFESNYSLIQSGFGVTESESKGGLDLIFNMFNSKKTDSDGGHSLPVGIQEFGYIDYRFRGLIEVLQVGLQKSLLSDYNSSMVRSVCEIVESAYLLGKEFVCEKCEPPVAGDTIFYVQSFRKKWRELFHEERWTELVKELQNTIAIVPELFNQNVRDKQNGLSTVVESLAATVAKLDRKNLARVPVIFDVVQTNLNMVIQICRAQNPENESVKAVLNELESKHIHEWRKQYEINMKNKKWRQVFENLNVICDHAMNIYMVVKLLEPKECPNTMFYVGHDHVRKIADLFNDFDSLKLLIGNQEFTGLKENPLTTSDLISFFS